MQSPAILNETDTSDAKELGITQTGIYKKMKLSTTTFYNAINGGRVQIHCVERFADLLGLTEEELIIKDDEK